MALFSPFTSLDTIHTARIKKVMDPLAIKLAHQVHYLDEPSGDYVESAVNVVSWLGG